MKRTVIVVLLLFLKIPAFGQGTIKIDPELKGFFQKFELLKELKDELKSYPETWLEISLEPELHERGKIGIFFSNKKNHHLFEGKILMIPPEKLKNRADIDSYESSLYHELIHARQEYKLWNYFTRGNPYNMPAWQVNYYITGYLSEGRYNGSEFDAYYHKAFFEKKELGEVKKSTLAGFFTYYLRMKMSDSYRVEGRVKKMVNQKYEEVVEWSGYTLEKFIQFREE